nr:cystin-1 [Macaca nemestrina]
MALLDMEFHQKILVAEWALDKRRFLSIRLPSMPKFEDPWRKKFLPGLSSNALAMQSANGLTGRRAVHECLVGSSPQKPLPRPPPPRLGVRTPCLGALAPGAAASGPGPAAYPCSPPRPHPQRPRPGRAPPPGPARRSRRRAGAPWAKRAAGHGRTLRRRRSPESLPAGAGSGCLEGGTGSGCRWRGPEAPGAAGPDGGVRRDPSPWRPPRRQGRDARPLLDQLLAESAAWGPPEPAPRRPARPRPTAVAGSAVSAEQSTEGHPGSGSVSEAPGSSGKKPERPAAISYDHAEEGLMASIEREYCR